MTFFKLRLTVWSVFISLFMILLAQNKNRAYGVPVSSSSKSVPSLLVQSDADNYAFLATFAADAYCTGLQIGSKFGQDGTLLWKAGDGIESQMVFIAYSPKAGIVISHEGTNQSSPDSLENDLRIQKVAMKSTFVRIEEQVTTNQSATTANTNQQVQVAQGFQDAWLQTSEQILQKVNETLLHYPNQTITITGHSLGAAISLFGALAIRDAFPNVTVETVLFGMPRVGNSAFANLVDSILPNQKHIINKLDPIPHLPLQSMGFKQASGEVWIEPTSNNQTITCPGQENSFCSDSIHLANFDLNDHDGPYFGIQMECSIKGGESDR